MSFTFTFGKYKGHSIEKVPEDYIRWIMDQDRLRMTMMQEELDRRRTPRKYQKLIQEQEWSLERIVTGGQTGADLGALFAASASEIETGGYAPHNYRTEDGPAEWLVDFGLLEGGIYRDQYGFNIADDISDGSIIFGKLTGGCSIMREIIKMQHKKVLYIAGPPFVFRPDECATWMRSNQARKVHIGGNKESKTPGMQEAVQQFMLEVFELVKKGWTDDDRVPF